MANEIGGRTLGSLIRCCRHRQSKSIRAFSQELGVSPSWLSKVERDVEVPGSDTLRAICTALGIRYDDAIFLSGNYDAVGEAIARLDAKVRKGRSYKGVTLTMTHAGGYYCQFEDYNGELANSESRGGIVEAIEEAERRLVDLTKLKNMAIGVNSG